MFARTALPVFAAATLSIAGSAMAATGLITTAGGHNDPTPHTTASAVLHTEKPDGSDDDEPDCDDGSCGGCTDGGCDDGSGRPW